MGGICSFTERRFTCLTLCLLLKTLLTFELFQLDKYINKKGNADRFSERELTPVFMLDGVHLNVFPTLVLHFNVPLDEYFI